jgi:hypothetical protein
MKNLLLLSLFTLFTNLIYCQDIICQTHFFDTFVNIDIPGDIYVIDTTIKEIHMYMQKSNIDNTYYLVQKSLFNETNINGNLPYDDASLEEFYEEVIKGIIKAVPAKLSKKTSVKVNGLKSYQIEFVDPADNLIYSERFYLLNKNLYMFTIYNFQGLDTASLSRFFNSIQIQNIKNISQFRGHPLPFREQSLPYRIGYLIGDLFISIIIIGGIIWIIRRKKKYATYKAK